MTQLLWPLLAAAGGVMWGLCFGRQPLPWLGAVALVPLLVALAHSKSRRFAFLLAWVHGVAGWLTGIPWIVYTLRTYGGLPTGLSWVLLFGLAGFLSLYQGLFGLFAARWLRRPVGWTLLAVPALWTALEWLGGWLFGGFPWNLGGYVWVSMPGALPLTAWIGAWGISFLVVAFNTGLAASLESRTARPALAMGLPVVLLLAFGVLTAPADEPDGGEPVRLIQPNTANAITPDWQKIRQSYQRVFDLSREACDRRGALLVWPESAAWPYELETPGANHVQFRADVERLAAQGCPVILNSAFTDDHGRLFNSAFLVTPEGEHYRYDKRELVPWGEDVPLGDILPFVGKLARNAGEFTPGESVGLLPWGEQKLGMAICFEAAFPARVAETVQAGATMLATISNDAWYGDSAARWQLFRAVRFRAAENRRSMLRAAITGITAVVTPAGAVRDRLPVDTVGVVSTQVRGRSDRTLFSRAPWLVPVLSWLLSAFVIVRSRRRKTR
ncbi:MAG: apolipoprotein N-acyltransferase [Acidobacteria bacterium]|nr:apolipoprotein N-acyltransferase [Acidobacteriota bacterium]